MFGIVLVGIAQCFAEISTSLGKYEVARKRESLYAMGFLNAFWATIFLIVIGLFRGTLTDFSLASIPTAAVRLALEYVLMLITLNAVLSADRSTFAFLRTLTIPLLLGADIFLGYMISTPQLIGISLMVIAIVLLTLNHGLSRRGKLLTLLSALIPVATISLYKYNITNFNSVEAEQTVQHIFLLVALLITARIRTGENLLPLVVQRRYLSQTLSAGVAYVCLSYAYLFAPASIITAGKRAFEILTAILFGHTMFKEKHILLKLAAFVLMVVGVGLIVV
jgi:drug/metabolite transporter (DMT)-like permease